MNQPKYEKDILSTFKIFILADVPFAGGAPSGPGINLVSGIGPVKSDAFEIPIQFPPKIGSDSKSANWTTTDKMSWEPLAIWQGASARKLSIELKYVIDCYDSSTDINGWSGQKISNIAHLIKAYFYRSIEASGRTDGLVPAVIIKSLYGSVQEESSWRLNDASVSHDGAIIMDATTSQPMKAPIDVGNGGIKTLSNLNAFDMSVFGLSIIPKLDDYKNSNLNATQRVYRLQTTINMELESYHSLGGIGDKQSQVGNNLFKKAKFTWY